MGVPKGCLEGACQGIEWHKMGKCVKHTLIDQNMLNMFNQE